MNNISEDQVNVPENEFSEALKASVSALVDGELSRSESAFLLKRIEHDAPLRALWLRYQDAGDCLRGQTEALRLNDFSAAVMAKLNSSTFVDAPELPNFSANLPAAASASLRAAPDKAPRESRRLANAVRYIAAAAMAATVAAVTISLPSFNQQPAEPALGLADAAAGVRAAQTLPITIQSAGVSAQPVSNRLSGGSGMLLSQSGFAPLAIDAFLQEHSQGLGGRSAIAPMVYSVSEADVGYLVPSTWESAATAP